MTNINHEKDHFLSRYLKQKLPVFLCFFLCALVMLYAAQMYRLPLTAVCYALILCFAICLVFLVAYFIRTRRRHAALLSALHSSPFNAMSLPQTTAIIDSDYTCLCEALQTEITKSRETAERKLADMTDFYTTWVHQIKTPIAAMKLTLENEDTPAARQLGADLFRTCQYVEMVLAYLRLDSESTDYVFHEYTLDALLRPSLRKFAPEFIQRKLKLNYEPINLCLVTDEKWFAFLFEQLLSNALKYTPSGSVSVCSPQMNTLCIRDTGIGISPDDLPRIFEKGYTGHNGRLQKEASGLGLYLSRRICRNLGITIRIESTPDQGTTVFLLLPNRRLPLE